MRCQEVMQKWLGEHSPDKGSRVKTCLQILQKANACGYDELTTNAIKTIARFKHETFTGVNDQSKLVPGFTLGTKVFPPQFPAPPLFPSSFASPAQYPIENDCKELFEGLPEKVKTDILLERLRICDK